MAQQPTRDQMARIVAEMTNAEAFTNEHGTVEVPLEGLNWRVRMHLQENGYWAYGSTADTKVYGPSHPNNGGH